MAILAVIVGGTSVGYLHNNEETNPASQSALSESRDRAIGWVRAHEAEALAAENPALWWMIKESATLSKDAYLASLFDRYYQRYLAHNPGNVWHHLFDDDSNRPIPIADIEGWPDYNLLFLYGLSCQSDLRADPRVKQLLNGRACATVGSPDYFRDPACITHQLMGIRFIQKHRCENSERIGQLASMLVDRTVLDEAWDFRVVDFYLQRVLMLAESQAVGKINLRWIARILVAQRSDGGWDDFDELLRFDDDKSIGWSGRGIRLRKPESNFHTTAQGLYLMTLLSANEIQ
jgi:hypothetical protein